MLPAAQRLRDRRDFAATVRTGARAGRTLLVVHLDVPADTQTTRSRPCARAGFVVSKAVGGSVVRHAVVRKLRHQIAPLLSELPSGTRLVVRALPGAGSATSAELALDLRAALLRAGERTRRVER